jgi:hypothetical protein
VSRSLGDRVDRRAIRSEPADAAWSVEKRDRSVEITANLNGGEVMPQRAWLDLQPDPADDDGVVVTDDAVLLVAEDLAQ